MTNMGLVLQAMLVVVLLTTLVSQNSAFCSAFIAIRRCTLSSSFTTLLSVIEQMDNEMGNANGLQASEQYDRENMIAIDESLKAGTVPNNADSLQYLEQHGTEDIETAEDGGRITHLNNLPRTEVGTDEERLTTILETLPIIEDSAQILSADQKDNVQEDTSLTPKASYTEDNKEQHLNNKVHIMELGESAVKLEGELSESSNDSEATNADSNHVNNIQDSPKEEIDFSQNAVAMDKGRGIDEKHDDGEESLQVQLENSQELGHINRMVVETACQKNNDQALEHNGTEDSILVDETLSASVVLENADGLEIKSNYLEDCLQSSDHNDKENTELSKSQNAFIISPNTELHNTMSQSISSAEDGHLYDEHTISICTVPSVTDDIPFQKQKSEGKEEAEQPNAIDTTAPKPYEIVPIPEVDLIYHEQEASSGTGGPCAVRTREQQTDNKDNNIVPDEDSDKLENALIEPTNGCVTTQSDLEPMGAVKENESPVQVVQMDNMVDRKQQYTELHVFETDVTTSQEKNIDEAGQNKMSGNVISLEASEHDSTEGFIVAKQSLEAPVICHDATGLKGESNSIEEGPQDPSKEVEEQALNRSFNTMIVSHELDGSEGSSLPIISTEADYLHQKHMSAYNKPSVTNDCVIQKVTANETEKEERESSDLKTTTSALILSEDLQHNKKKTSFNMIEQQRRKEDTVGYGERDNELRHLMVPTSHNCSILDDQSISANIMQDLLVQESESCEEKLLNDCGVVEENKDESEQQHPELGLVCDKFTLLQWEKVVALEVINAHYIESIDSEIKQLVAQDDTSPFEKASKSEPNKCERNNNQTQSRNDREILERELFTNGSEIGSVKSHLIVLNSSQEEQKVGNGGSKDLFIELDIENVHGKEMSRQDENLADSTYVNSMEYTSNPDKVMEKDEAVNSALLEGLIEEGIQEEKVEHGTGGSNSKHNLLENNEIDEELFSLSYTSFSPVESSSTKMEKKAEDLNAMGELAEGTVVQLDGQTGSQSKEVIMPEEQMPQINAEDIAIQASHQPEISEPNNLIEPHDVIIECFHKSEQKQTAFESQAVVNKEVSFSELDQLANVNGSNDACPQLQELSSKTFLSLFELEGGNNMHDEKYAMGNQIITEAMEVSNLECGIMSQTEEQSNLIAHETLEISNNDVKPSENIFRSAIEANKEKLSSLSDELRTSYTSESLVEETENSPLLSQKEDCKRTALPHQTMSVKHLISTYERRNTEPREDPARHFTTSEAKIEEFMQNTAQDYKKTTIGDALESKKFAGETMGNEEAITKVTVQSELPMLESDRSPLLYKKKVAESESYASESSDSGKLKAPLLSLLKESIEKQEGLVLKKSAEDFCRPRARKFTATSPRKGQKQKSRYSLLGNCMCCTTAID